MLKFLSEMYVICEHRNCGQFFVFVAFNNVRVYDLFIVCSPQTALNFYGPLGESGNYKRNFA